MSFPREWTETRLSIPLNRNIFADWLEEQGDWRAEEVRRFWVEYKGNTFFVYNGGVRMYGFDSLKDANLQIANLIAGLFNQEDWRITSKNQVYPKICKRCNNKGVVYLDFEETPYICPEGDCPGRKQYETH